MTDGAAPTARSAWWHAALVAGSAALVLLTDASGPWRAALESLIFLLGIAAVRTALHRHHATATAAWRGVGAALLLFTLSNAVDVPAQLAVAPQLLSPVEIGLDVAAYGSLMVAALAQLAVGRRHDREAWIDTASLLVATGLALVSISAEGDHRGQGLVEFAPGIPLATVIVLVVAVPLAVPDNGRSLSALAVLTSGLLAIAGFGSQAVGGAVGEMRLMDELPLFAVAALVLAARHPSVSRLGRPADAAGTVSAGRMLGLAAALLVSPALLVLHTVDGGGVALVLGVGSTLLTLLALYRLAMVASSREQTRAALAASEAKLRLLLEHAADAIAIIDASGTVTYMSPAVEPLLGRPAAAYVGRSAVELADLRDRERLRALLGSAGEPGAGAGGGSIDTDIRLEHSAGGSRWVEARISGEVDAAGLHGWVVNLREVTDRKLFEDELRRQATTDPLTGLLNRTAFNDRLVAATADADPAAPPAVLFVDVDDFKSVNDTLGHAAGDELLLAVAARLSADVRGNDVVARLGGDEFALLLADADADRLREVADRLLAAVRLPVEIAGRTVAVTASIGGALAGPGCTAEELLHRADTAMYSAKRGGKDSRSLLDGTPAHAPLNEA